MAKFTVTAYVREEIEVEADDEEEAVLLAQNREANEFTFIDAQWSAEPTVDPVEG